MKNNHPLESIVGIILIFYAEKNESGLKTGNDFFGRYLAEMSAEQKQLLFEARTRCEAALEHPLRHFTGGFSCFKPF